MKPFVFRLGSMAALVSLAGVAIATAPSFSQEPVEVVEEVDSLKAVRADYNGLQAAARRGKSPIEAADVEALVKRALALAEGEGFGAYKLVLDLPTRDFDELARYREQALKAIIADHVDDPENMVPLVLRSLGGEDAAGTRVTIGKKATNRSVQAACHYADAMAVVSKMRRNDVDKSDRLAAIAKLELIESEYGAEDDHYRYGTWAKAAAGPLFQLRNLHIGAVAPDIEGQDLNGVAFRLSDYRGKVVVLDFWGNW